jgi:DNA mismatch repair ATPase MutS
VATTFTYKDASDPAEILKKYLFSDQSKWPEPLVTALGQTEAKLALGLSLVFLQRLLLADTSIPVATFTWTVGTEELSLNKTMLIDAQAIEHLDILPPYFGSKLKKVDGSLFTFLSHGCSTAFGKRMLKRWTVNPLYDVKQIQLR